MANRSDQRIETSVAIVRKMVRLVRRDDNEFICVDRWSLIVDIFIYETGAIEYDRLLGLSRLTFECFSFFFDRSTNE